LKVSPLLTSSLTSFVVAAAALSAAACNDTAAPTSATPSVTLDRNTVNPAEDYSFVVVGCNRVDKTDTAGNPSTANIVQLRRTLQEIAKLPKRPRFLFFAGDLTLGYTSDTVQLATELRAWRALYEASPLAKSGTELVAIPGNHETQDASKIAYAAAERTWLRVMDPYIKRGGNGPKAGGPDNLATDQSRLTYSFDFAGAHFITLNTDPVGNDWHVPTQWVAADIQKAHAAGAKHIFAIGHKPAYPYPTVPTDGLAKFPASRDSLWNALIAGNAEAMFSAHNHVYFRAQPITGKTWQVIAGNGGSSLETTIDLSIPSSGEYYGFVVTTVRPDGRVYAKSYGRDVPAAGYIAMAPESLYPTTVRDSVELTQH